MNSNKKQKEFWTDLAGKIWVEGKNEKDNMLLPLGNELLKRSKIISGMKVLEVGCGTGYIMGQLSKKVGKNGHVTGVDISHTMISEAERYLNNHGVANTTCKVLDAENDDLGTFKYDIIVSRFGVMFFNNPIKAFKNLIYSLKDNSYIYFICWQDHRLNPWNSVPLRIVKKYIDLPVIEEQAPSPFAFANKDYIYEILNNSEYQNINIDSHSEIIELHKGFNLYDGVKDYLHKTPIFTKQYFNLSNDKKNKLFEDLLEELQEYHVDNVFKFDAKTWIVSAQK
tara:strand:- start:12547 stop:13392 length:846 start_codon:yes stop_codon:yes gene_type:complete